MEKKYSFYNTITGWIVWLFATAVYLMTMESSASFWDCGEFIAAGYKLQVGHPPGAPLWLMIARVFGLFAGDNLEAVASMMNAFSALCSSFSILFLFWTITGFAKKLAGPVEHWNSGKIIAILASGVVGALAYTFSDSFWFSAVEAEVYAASSFTTALVFWLLVKWDANADNQFADRYLILVAYVMGLSIGVHILNLLAIPALVYIYYFKRFEITRKGFIAAGALSIAIVGVIQYGIISFAVKLAAKFEVFFTNSFGLPFNTGAWIFILTLFAALIYGIYYSSKKKLSNLQNAIYGVLVIVIGYSSFAMIVVRSAANPPMDENNPENIVNLLPYLNREQYGDRPLFYGQSFSSELDVEERYSDGTPVYYQRTEGGKDKYEIADKREGSIPNYDKATCMYFPRMYSSQSSHEQAYKSWTDFKGKKVRVKALDASGRVTKKYVRVPTFSENASFFFSYQVNFMYWRYFMWNFAGRQNDIQGHGLGSDKVLHGNWISGLNFIDKEHVGDQESLPESLKKNPGRNAFYMLPLILGIIGMIFHFAKNWKDALVVLLLFFMTGLAIVIYLNQTPYQPRERDYAYAGSFYAFAIWIGLGVQALFTYMASSKKLEGSTQEKAKLEDNLKAMGLFEIGATVVFILIWGAIFSFGDLTTEGYSLLYIGGVIAGAVALAVVLGRVVKSEAARAVLVSALTLYVPYVMGKEGWDDHNRNDKYTARDFAKNYLSSVEKNAIIFTNGDNDTFPLWYVQEVEGFRTDVRVVNLSLLNTDWYIDQMKRKAYDSEKVPFSMTQDQYRQGTRDWIYIQKRWSGFQDIKKVMDFVKSDNRNTKIEAGNGDFYDYLPADSLSVLVDKNKVLANGTVNAEFANQIPAVMNWGLQGRHLTKAQIMILDLLANNDWERPVYFAITVGDSHYMNLEEYFQLEGLAYHLTPIKRLIPQGGEIGWVDVDKMYDNMMNKFQWGNMEKPGVYMGEQVQRMTMNYRNNFARLAKALVEEKGDTVRAVQALDRCMEVMPKEKIPYNYFSLFLADAYNKCGEFEKGAALMLDIMNTYYEEMQWYAELDKNKKALVAGEVDRAHRAIRTIGFFASRYPQLKDVQDKVQEMVKNFDDLGFGVN